ncbi:MAG: DUF2079 domain-containing protein [Ferroplasma sp.]|uniref:DUF2079 domain-containing protein n=1 Tax=Ferroplasma sp. TaxID=2591003 RepID=UPI002814C302|nr:DUF2079 domain-containing protein [Ferroplasma sp.]WMT50624.1 MAG: DUF2079 domain-containing protein [Ferroplasma sp.]
MQKQTKIDIIILSAFTILFSILSSIISYLKYISFNDSVYDLGVSSALIKNALTSPVAYHKLIYFLIFPVYHFFPSQVGLMVFQDFFICAGSIPLYFISRRVIDDRKYSVIISLLWLLYFPLSGVQWFDFHFMALFPTLFLAGFAFFVYGKYRESLILMFLAGITDLLAPFILIFLVIILIIKKSKVPKYYLYSIIFTVAAIIILVFTQYPSYILGLLNLYSLYANPAILYASLNRKILYFVLAGIPLGLISFTVPEALLIVPYIGLVFVHNYTPYFQPVLYQYPALIASGMFISFIYGLKRISSGKLKVKIKHIMPAVVAITVITWLLFTPYGNLITNNNSGIQYANEISMGNYDTHSAITYTLEDGELNSMIVKIPEGSSVAIQNNMPQLVQSYNYVLPCNGYNGSPQYIITDPYSVWFYNVGIAPNTYTNTLTFVNEKLSSGNYGILYEESGMILMERGYAGKPIKFIPYKASARNNSIINFIPPGNYSIQSNVNITLISSSETYNIVPDNGHAYFQITKYITGVRVEFNSNMSVAFIQKNYII